MKKLKLKLKLELDALAVESFESGGAVERRGTVRGNAPLTTLCDSIQICKLTVVGSEPGGSCGLECTGTCGNTYGDCCGGSGYFTCQYCYG